MGEKEHCGHRSSNRRTTFNKPSPKRLAARFSVPLSNGQGRVTAFRHKYRLKRHRFCVICMSRKNIEQHHLGGQNHSPLITVPLCGSHHLSLTIAIRRAGVDMTYTDDKAERVRRALRACAVFQWYVCLQSQIPPERLGLLGKICSIFHRHMCRRLFPKEETNRVEVR